MDQNPSNDFNQEVSSDFIPTIGKDEIEPGFVGSMEHSPDLIQRENVAEYDYAFAMGGNGGGGSKSIQGIIDAAQSRSIIQEDTTEDASGEQLLDAYFASYPEEIPTESISRGLEVVIGQDDRKKLSWTETLGFPYRMICALKITAQNGSRWVGTGWLAGPRTVITAGHCVYMHDQGGWAKSIEVIPAQNSFISPWKTSSGSLRSVTGWTQNKDSNYDYGAIILPASAAFGNMLGFFGFASLSDATLMSKFLNISGYPGDKGHIDQWYHGRTPSSLTGQKIFYTIDTAGGQSGAPIWYVDGNNRTVVGIHTNGASTANSGTRINSGVFSMISNWKNV